MQSEKSNASESTSTATSVLHPLQFHKSDNGKHYAEFIRYDVDAPVSAKPSWDYLKVDPRLSTQPSAFQYQKRDPRSDEYDSYEKGYQEFLRNYHKDGDHDNYKVNEEQQEEDDEEDIGRSDDEDDDEDDDSGNSSDENNSSSQETEDSESEEKYHKPKKSIKAKGKKSKDDGSDEEYDRIKQESNKKKKSKHCRTEKRSNGMVCNVCHNPKNDENSEQCSYSSDPPDKKYAYSKGKKFNSKDNDNSKEDYKPQRELTTRRPQSYRYRQNYPASRSQPHYRKYPQPIVQYGTPRYQIYRTIPAMILRPQQQTHYYPRIQQPKKYPRRYTQMGQESRLYRNVVGYDYGRPRNAAIKKVRSDNRRVKGKKTLKNEYVSGRASDENVDKKFADFITKDWSNCERSFENGLICYECDDKKGSHKECMFVSENKPNESHSGYSKVYKYASGTHGNVDHSNESDVSDDESTTHHGKGKSSAAKKRKPPKNHSKSTKAQQQQQEEPEIIKGEPYEFVRPYTENSDESNSYSDSEEKHILKRMAGEKTDNQNRTTI